MLEKVKTKLYNEVIEITKLLNWQHCKKQFTPDAESDFYDPQLPLAGQKL